MIYPIITVQLWWFHSALAFFSTIVLHLAPNAQWQEQSSINAGARPLNEHNMAYVSGYVKQTPYHTISFDIIWTTVVPYLRQRVRYCQVKHEHHQKIVFCLKEKFHHCVCGLRGLKILKIVQWKRTAFWLFLKLSPAENPTRVSWSGLQISFSTLLTLPISKFQSKAQWNMVKSNVDISPNWKYLNIKIGSWWLDDGLSGSPGLHWAATFKWHLFFRQPLWPFVANGVLSSGVLKNLKPYTIIAMIDLAPGFCTCFVTAVNPCNDFHSSFFEADFASRAWPISSGHLDFYACLVLNSFPGTWEPSSLLCTCFECLYCR